MKVRTAAQVGGQRTFVIVFDTDDEAMAGLLAFARDHQIEAASFTAIGAFRSAVLGYFEVERRDYKRLEFGEQVEVLALTGNIARTAEGPKVHAHAVLGRADGSACGGHLLEARVRPTLEVVAVETPRPLRRITDPATGLPLIDLDAGP